MGLVEGKSGIVTGAASGIGRGCAIGLAAQGAAVVVNDLEWSRAAALEGADANIRVDLGVGAGYWS
jgi:NAD(P)-dependent dehydrogenase (short-subunit alcohol dehydrogenase family)